MAGPLTGVRVVEMASFITGPYAAQVLGDLGAEVIKVEHPEGGDPFRAWGSGLYSPIFTAFNRNKRSLALDVKLPAGRAVLLDVLRTADVFVQNFRPGVVDRLGVGYVDVAGVNERIVYCSISGFGSDGPYAHRPSYDTVGQGLSGLLSVLTDREDPRPVGPALSDFITGGVAAQGILAALVARGVTGRGQHVETNMLQATVGALLDPFARYFATGQVSTAETRPRMSQAYAFRCADGNALLVHLSSPDKFWRALACAAGAETLVDDERFATHGQRVRNYQALHQALAPAFARRPRAEWLGILEDADVPHAPINTVDQVLEDPQVQHLRLVEEACHPTEGTVRLLRSPLTFSDTPVDTATAPPTLGEHTAAILADLGYGADRITELRAGGAVK